LLATSKGHDFIGSHAKIRSAAQSLQKALSPGIRPGPLGCLSNFGMVTHQVKLDLSMRQESQLFADFLRDSDLSFGGDSHGITPYSKNIRGHFPPEAI
jgi:hypothetical protein